MERADRDRARQLPRLPDFASACASCLPLPASSPLRASHCSVFLLSPSPHPFDFPFFFLKEFVFVFHVNSWRLPSPRLGRGSPFHSRLLPRLSLPLPPVLHPRFLGAEEADMGTGGGTAKSPIPAPVCCARPGKRLHPESARPSPRAHCAARLGTQSPPRGSEDVIILLMGYGCGFL